MDRRTSRSAGTAFDAAGASGLNFLTSQLAMIDPVVTRPLQSQTYERDISIRYGGGLGAEMINAWAAAYAAPGGGQLGLQGTTNTDVPLVQVDLQQGTWRAFLWLQGFVIQYLDLERLEFATRTGGTPPISMQQLYEDAIDSTFKKAMDRVTYLGWLGFPGLVNNPAVAAINLSLPFSEGTTPIQILNAVNTVISTAIASSVYDLGEGVPNRMLVPWSRFGFLSQPMTTAGSESLISYIERENVAAKSGTSFKILPLPDPWTATQGVGGTARTVIYRNDPSAVDMFVPQIPTKIMTAPTTRNGVGYETVFAANIGQVRWKRPQTALYGDGI